VGEKMPYSGWATYGNPTGSIGGQAVQLYSDPYGNTTGTIDEGERTLRQQQGLGDSIGVV
jgi:hypothetical protein